MRYCTILHEKGFDMDYTTEYWRARKAAGLVRVRFAGMSGDGTDVGVIKRVTTCTVFVQLTGEREVSRLHPADIRPR